MRYTAITRAVDNQDLEREQLRKLAEQKGTTFLAEGELRVGYQGHVILAEARCIYKIRAKSAMYLCISSHTIRSTSSQFTANEASYDAA